MLSSQQITVEKKGEKVVIYLDHAWELKTKPVEHDGKCNSNYYGCDRKCPQ